MVAVRQCSKCSMSLIFTLSLLPKWIIVADLETSILFCLRLSRYFQKSTVMVFNCSTSSCRWFDITALYLKCLFFLAALQLLVKSLLEILVILWTPHLFRMA